MCIRMQELKRNVRGKASDEALLEAVKDCPGLSQYELSRMLKWPAGRVDGSVRRLLNEGKIVVRVLERNGRRVNLVYLKNQEPSDIIEVPAELFQEGNPDWSKRVFIYALDSSMIGISGRPMTEWKGTSCFLEEIPIQRSDGKIVMRVPERFWRFYGLERRHRVVSVNGNNILITITGNIIQQKKYPT